MFFLKLVFYILIKCWFDRSCVIQEPVVNRPGVTKQASIRRVRRQSELPVSTMMSPDSSQSSSDSVAAWQRLTSTGQKYTPYVVSCVKFWSAIIYADFICCVTLLSIYLILIYIYYQYKIYWKYIYINIRYIDNNVSYINIYILSISSEWNFKQESEKSQSYMLQDRNIHLMWWVVYIAGGWKYTQN